MDSKSWQVERILVPKLWNDSGFLIDLGFQSEAIVP
jgi:hypothetical protein